MDMLKHLVVAGLVLAAPCVAPRAATLHEAVGYAVLSVKAPAAAAVPVLAIDTTGFDPAVLDQADQNTWHDLENRIDGRYPLLKSWGRSRIVGQFLRMARSVGSRYHNEYWFALPEGEVVFNWLGYDGGK